MQKTFLIRFLVTVLALGCVIHIVFFRQYGIFPFQWQRRSAHTFVIQPKQGQALPAGLRAGDRFDPREQNLTTRVALHVNIRPGGTYTFLVHRDGRILKVPVTTQRPVSHEAPVSTVFFGLFLALMLALGLSTFWWGSDWSAWGLSLFALGLIFSDFLNIPLPPLASFAALILSWTVVFPLFLVGLYITAVLLAGPELSRRLRWLFKASFTLLLVSEVAIIDERRILPAIYGIYGLRFELPTLVLYVILLFIPVVVLFSGYVSMDTGRRARVRWVLWSLTLFIAAIVWNTLNQQLDLETGFIGQATWWLVSLCALIGLIYGLLFKRVVRLSFIINRAAVYGLTAIVVVGIFALLGALIQSFTIGGNAGLALTLGVSLIVGLGLEAVKKRIDSLVERLFFRRKFLAESTLRCFARQCAFIEHPERLLDEAVTEIRDYVQVPSVAFYERAADSYVRVRQRGRDAFPECIETDDRAFIALRAELSEQDLNRYKSALGTDGYGFPMAVRGRLQGALVIGARPEHYAPDERELLAHVASQVAMALHALCTRENETLMRAFASGEIEPTLARERVRQLFSMKV